METPSSRLSALDIDLPAVASPVAVHVPATLTGSLVYAAGPSFTSHPAGLIAQAEAGLEEATAAPIDS